MECAEITPRRQQPHRNQHSSNFQPACPLIDPTTCRSSKVGSLATTPGDCLSPARLTRNNTVYAMIWPALQAVPHQCYTGNAMRSRFVRSLSSTLPAVTHCAIPARATMRKRDKLLNYIHKRAHTHTHCHPETPRNLIKPCLNLAFLLWHYEAKWRYQSTARWETLLQHDQSQLRNLVGY